MTRPAKYFVRGKKRTVRELTEMAGLPDPRVMRHRVNKCLERSWDLERVFDDDFWHRNNASTPKKFYRINGVKLTAGDIARIKKISKDTVDSRIRTCLKNKWPVYVVMDETIWQKRGKKPNKVEYYKKYVTGKPTKKEFELLQKIPEPSPVERRMEKMGLL